MKNFDVTVRKSTNEIEAVEETSQQLSKGKKLPVGKPEFYDNRDFVLTQDEAQAAIPDDGASCGEEDIGSGLESLVSKLE